jgi:signal transduction histidine kinase
MIDRSAVRGMARSVQRSELRPVARSDLRWVLVGTLATFAVASAFELQEKLAAAALRFEAWQIDELPLTLTALSLGLAWYAWRRRAEAARLLAHNRELAQQLIGVQESERRALARELHDDLAQHCTSIRIEAACIERSRDATETIAAARRAATAAELLYESVRRLLRRLRPAELDELGLVAALQAACDAHERRGAMRCRFEASAAGDGDGNDDGDGGAEVAGGSAAAVNDAGTAVTARTGGIGGIGGIGAGADAAAVFPPLGEAIDTAVYRVAQEGLANAARHAGARCVALRLQVARGELTLQIEDDGRGFEPATRTRGLGLLGAAERAAALGGELQVSSAPGAGTRLCLRLPLGASAGRCGAPPASLTRSAAA